MYELRQLFKTNLRPILAHAGVPLLENLILSAFDQAVEDEAKRGRAELERAGLVSKAS